MNRRKRQHGDDAATEPMPFESLLQTKEWWVAFWESQRREGKR